jgi:hypothetical protein
LYRVPRSREFAAASVEAIRASLARQRDAMSSAPRAVVDKTDGQTDDFLAMMGQITNGLGV